MIAHARTYATTAAIATPDCLPVTIAAVRARLVAAHLVRLGPVRVDVVLGDELRDAEAAVAEFGLTDSPLVALFRACPRDVVLVVGAVQVPNQRDGWN
jgi:hypothetical protein